MMPLGSAVKRHRVVGLPNKVPVGIKNGMDIKGLAARVRARREELGLSMRSLDEKAGVGTSTTSRLERMERASQTHQTIQALAKALDVTAEWLLTGVVEPPPPPAPRPELVVERVEMPTELAELLAAERAAGRGWPQQVIDAALTLRHLQGERLSHADWRTFLNEVELTGRRPLKVPAYQVPVPTAEEAAAAQAARIEAVLKKRRENNE